MNTSLYKKSGLVLMWIARDFYILNIGERIPTIAEYAQRFSASRGIIQNAISELEEKGCIQITKSGVKGTYLTDIDYEKLTPYTDWGAITGTMPVPLTPTLASLTTAVCSEMEQSPFPFSFAYVTGSQKRLQMLEKMMYDFIIVSKSTANAYLSACNFLEEALVLEDCEYSKEYQLFFIDKNKTEIEDGMRVGIDTTCLDQYTISKKLCEGKQVTYVQLPYIALAQSGAIEGIDCIVYRKNSWYNHSPDFGVKDIDIPGFTAKETMTPVILVNKDNYGFKNLLTKCLNVQRLKEIQEKVQSGELPTKFY